MEKGWIKIRAYEDPVRAEMDKQFLEENGIPAVVLNKQDSSLKFGRIDIYVNERTAADAAKLLLTLYSQDEEE